jgi:hypothetical protein
MYAPGTHRKGHTPAQSVKKMAGSGQGGQEHTKMSRCNSTATSVVRKNFKLEYDHDYAASRRGITGKASSVAQLIGVDPVSARHAHRPIAGSPMSPRFRHQP